ncbi:MAG: hypothetical protein H0V09_09225 [Gemmatimonadetes bacterium]|nr:hypothetical protein [Gemmatimonadota bacterium]
MARHTLSRVAFLLAALSTLGFSPASSGGHSPETPPRFDAYARGEGVVVRWAPAAGASLYVGQIDDDPGFGSPSSWSVRHDGRSSYEHQLGNLQPDVYHVRLRSVQTFLVIRSQSDWTRVERVVVGGDGDWRDARDDDRDPSAHPSRGSIARDFPGLSGSPRELYVSVYGDDLHMAWRPTAGADRYVVQLDRDVRFRSPVEIFVNEDDRGGTQRVQLRNVPDGRWYVRVRPVETWNEASAPPGRTSRS